MLSIQARITQHKALQNALSYRAVRPVTRAIVYSSGDCYSICPRCHRPIDREYIRFCNHCGQRLGWTGPITADTGHTRMEAPRR